MDNPLLDWPYFFQPKSMDELRQCLLFTTMELQNMKIKAQEEMRIRDEQLFHLQDLLNKTIKERDEANEKYQTLVYGNLLLQQSTQVSGVSSSEDEPIRVINSSKSSSDYCVESIVSSPLEQEPLLPIVVTKSLPEKGKFLQAVMKAGPLLQTLLLAGPLPQWRHPPPPLDSHRLPPPPPLLSFGNCSDEINDGGRVKRKRDLDDEFNTSNEAKYGRVVHQ